MFMSRTGKRRPAPATATRSVLGAHLRDESGAVLIFALFILVLMLMVGGMSVDLMRYEAERARVQSTADRAALAAAALTQTLDAEEVAADMFAKEGLSDNLVNTKILKDSLNGREVRVNTRLEVKPFFMQMMGIDLLASDGRGTAEERISNVEIALVLDISGSMVDNRSTRMANLQSAAEEFVIETLKNDEDKKVSISIVPYNGQVMLGPDLFSKYNVTHKHGLAGATCVDLPPEAYTTTALPRTLAMPQTAHADTWSQSFTQSTPPDSNSSSSYIVPDPGNRWCIPDAANEVSVHQNDSVELVKQIKGLKADGATSIDAGLKWGLTLLDPGTRQIVSEMVTAKKVPAVFSGRPLDYDDEEVLKVIVLMTDGEHFDQEEVNKAYKTGLSDIYLDNEGYYSIYHSSRSGTSKYYVPHKSAWYALPWGVTTTETCTGTLFNRKCTTTENWSKVKQQTWPQVWEKRRVKWVAHQLYARPLGGSNATNRTNEYNTWMANFRSQTHKDDMDLRLNALCSLAKAKDVLIFGIAFDAPDRGATAVRNCATADRFYRVVNDEDGAALKTVFRVIRSQISQLRLTE